MSVNKILQDKYPHLEVSVLKLSEVKDNESFRIDAEYFKKEYLENEDRVKNAKIINSFIDTRIKNIRSFKLRKNFNYLQISDIDLKNGMEYSVTEIDYKNIPDRVTYVLQNNDICVSSVRPNRNAVALIKNPKRLIGTSGFTILRLASKDILPEFLYIFCKTNYFITKMMRANTASLYPAILDSDIYGCKIPIFPMSFQLEIQKLVKDSHKALESSKALYKEAENLLYESLGLDSKNPLQSILNNQNQIPNYTIKTLKESFLQTGRLDSEYYQSKYEDIETKIHNFPTIKLKDLVQYPITSGATPKAGGSDYTDSENGIPFLRAIDLKNARVDIANLLYIKPEIHEKSLKRTNLMKGDILFSIYCWCNR